MKKTSEKVVVARSPEIVRLDVNKLPKHESDTLCHILIRSITEYFKQPGVQEEYEQWLEKRKAKGGAI